MVIHIHKPTFVFQDSLSLSQNKHGFSLFFNTLWKGIFVELSTYICWIIKSSRSCTYDSCRTILCPYVILCNKWRDYNKKYFHQAKLHTTSNKNFKISKYFARHTLKWHFNVKKKIRARIYKHIHCIRLI